METTETKHIVSITDTAVTELRNAGVSTEEFLRISIVSGGCSGLSYQMATDNVQTPFDVVIFENSDIRAITDKPSLEYLQGLEIDYSNDLINVGFRFTNPNATHTCGCGQSMSV